MRNAYKNNIGNSNALKTHLYVMIEVIAECVTENHERCKNNSTVCSGSRRPWILRYLNKNIKLSCTSQDMQILHGCIRYRLNEKNILTTRFQTNTIKTKAVNRAYNLRNPKHLTFSRNFQVGSTALCIR